MDVVITKNYTRDAAGKDIKREIFDYLVECLNAKYGEGSAQMIRINKVNQVGVIIGQGTGEDGVTSPICVAINPIVKEFTNHSTAKNEYHPFDMSNAVAEYQEQEEKNAKKAADKAADEAKREAKKAEIKAAAEANLSEF